MTLWVSRHGTGTSTKLISCRVQRRFIDYATQNGYVFNKWVNKACQELHRDLILDRQVDKIKYKLMDHNTWDCPYRIDYSGSIAKMIRLDGMVYESWKFNGYNIGRCINTALDRWIKQSEAGKKADYPHQQLGRRGKH